MITDITNDAETELRSKRTVASYSMCLGIEMTFREDKESI